MAITNEIKQLSLYHFQSCPYCTKTRSVLEKLDLEVELRDIRQDPEHRSTLTKQGGKTQVPSLRIDKTNGKSFWLYESEDIIRMLHYLNIEKLAA